MATFTHALAEQITLNRSFSDLVDLACFGRHLMASLAEKSAREMSRFGAQRLMQKKDNRYGTPLSKAPYDGLGNALNDQKWDPSSEWIKKDTWNGTTHISYKGVDANIYLSSFCFEDRMLTHTTPCYLPRAMEQTEKIFEECRILEGEALNRHLGEFFWWWCQSKPVILGDPSIGEMLFKAVLISKGIEPPGWKENIIPWEETVREYDGKRFGENFSSLCG